MNRLKSQLKPGNSLTTVSILPYYHVQNIRTEFRLNPNQDYISDLRLVDVQSGAHGRYAHNAGAWALIKNIYLYDGNVLVDSCPMASRVASTKLMAHENRVNKNLNHYLVNHHWTFYNRKDGNGRTVIFQAPDERFGDEEARLELGMVLNFLKTVQTFKFKEPRLVIEWNTDPNDVYIFTDVGNAVNIPKPTLLIDQINGPPLAKQNVVYWSWETDRLTMPDNVDKNKYRIQGFDRKRVGRMMIWNNAPNNGRNNLQRGNVSYAYNGENIQFFDDSSPILPVPMDETNFQRYWEDAFGSQNYPLLANLYAIPNADRFQDVNVAYSNANNSWKCLDLSGKEVKRLEIEYQRLVAGNVFTQYYVAEVAKQLSFDSEGNAVVKNL